MKIASTKQDINFITQCKSKRVFPNFMKLYSSVMNDRTKKVIYAAKNHWLKLELSHHYATLGRLELETYNLHLALTKIYDNNEWTEFHNNLCKVIEHKTKSKIEIHKKKLLKLCIQQRPNKPQQTTVISSNTINIVRNDSCVQLTDAELHLLNKGLKFSLTPVRAPIEDLAVAIQSNTARCTLQVKSELIQYSTNVIREIMLKPKNEEALCLHKTAKDIKNKDVIISKADKGNNIIILDHQEYLCRMNLMLNSGDYTELRTNPLNKMKSKVDDILNKYSKSLGKVTVMFLKSSNPQVPRMYGLPKIHKEGKQMRPIASNINAPTQKLAKWLIQKFNLLEPPTSLSIKNSIDFVDKVKNVRITRNETMISFDVKSLFPSIPVDKALECLKTWLCSNGVSQQLTTMYIEMTELCMEQNIFQFDGKFYRQNHGTAMGNSLSGFIAEVFMSDFEMKLKKQQLFPRIWYRYVDDVFAICAIRKADSVLHLINSQCSSIQFTSEREANNCLPFLDIMVTRIETSLDFSIYRKPTFCERLIPADSYHHYRHKMAVFHSMIHRLLNIPMSLINYEKELTYIHHLARVNGYESKEISNIVKKHLEKQRRSNMSTFFNVPKDEKTSRRIGLPYYPAVTKVLAPMFRKHDLEIVPKSGNTLRSILGSNKDSIPMLKKSGIYEVSCQSGCDAVYYGKTIRNIEKRFNEHMYQFKNGNSEKSGVAKHLIENGHKIDISNIKLVQEVNENRHIEIFETIHIRKNKHKNLMNADMGNVQSTLMNIF